MWVTSNESPSAPKPLKTVPINNSEILVISGCGIHLPFGGTCYPQIVLPNYSFVGIVKGLWARSCWHPEDLKPLTSFS